MPLRLDVKRRLSARSDRVKCVDLHPNEPWLLASLYNGNVHVWNHESQTLIKSFEVTDLPVRAGKFVPRKNWVVTGSDDMMIKVFNYNTLEKVYGFEAHSDYLRSLQVHPSQPYLLSSSDDMTIKLWDWDKKWTCIQVFEGHTHYVMQIVINPKDNNQFASASLDRTIKVWQLGSGSPNFTLEGHEKGVNCLDYFHGGDKPHLVSGADDRTVKIWDYQNKTCVQTLEGHAQNVSSVLFHPALPVILSGSEDGTVRIWHANTYRLESTLNYGMDRVWGMSSIKGSNNVAIGYDEGSIMVKLGREEPAMSMDSAGKIIFAKHSEILQANLKNLGDAEVNDGERLPLAVKEMGSCEIYPQNLAHNPNGRFVVVCGDGEYIIYTAMALRNKSFGAAQEFVWSADSSEYAARDGSKVKLFKNFKERKSFKPDFGAENIYGGALLGVRSPTGLSFHDWETTELVRRIEIQPKNVFWSDSGELCCIATEDSYFILKYSQDAVTRAMENKDELMTEDGVEDAFEPLSQIEEVIKTGLWVGDCFIYTNSVNRLNYFVGGEIVTISHLDRDMYLLGYIPKDNRLYLADKELNVVSYSLLLSVLEYQTAVMRKDFDTAKEVLPTIPKEQRNRVAHFLEKQGFKQQALLVSCDPEHRFELALQIGDLKVAYEIAVESDSEQKWKQIAELAIQQCEFPLAQECLFKAQDYAALLLLASCSCDGNIMLKLATEAEKCGKYNVAYLAYFSLGRLEDCLELLCKSNRLPEAAFLARTYLPSHVSRVVQMWKENLAQTNKKAADSLADPTQYENLFPDLQQAIKAEEFLKKERMILRPASEYRNLPSNLDRNVFEELRQAEESGVDIDEIADAAENLRLADAPAEEPDSKPSEEIQRPAETAPDADKKEKPEAEADTGKEKDGNRSESPDLDIDSDLDNFEEVDDGDDDIDIDDMDDDI
ncbi:coatomer subunit beta'-like isoform X2 [Rhopilema esculentum]|uniref:coatomer subunit beta'-like isoform X1 n=1 Tax=Rhopilema esculentum TaxID=499914 RepID=UPI0031D7426E